MSKKHGKHWLSGVKHMRKIEGHLRRYQSHLWVSFLLLGALLASGFLPHVLQAAPEAQTGLPWVFFNGSDLTRPANTGLDSQINVNTGTSPADYSKVWLGSVQAPVTGTVTFTAEADNGLKLWVGDILIIDGWTGSARSGSISMTQGASYPIRLEYFQNGGVGVMKLFWSWTGHAQELIPAGNLWHTEADLENIGVLAGQGYDTAKLYGESDVAPSTIALNDGPHLLLDNYYLAQRQNLTRIVNVPQRDPSIPNPIVTAAEDQIRSPFITVLRDIQTNLYRLWYGSLREDGKIEYSHLSYLESNDGINWIRPHVDFPDLPQFSFGTAVIDEGPEYADPSTRFKLGYYAIDGLKVAGSPDGRAWSLLTPETVVFHNHDITHISFDPVSREYVSTFSEYKTGPLWSGERRHTSQRRSTDLINWGPAYKVVIPDDRFDEGQTQFYAMDAYLTRGNLRVGMVKVLRDDLFADNPPSPPEAYGIGYTTLAWSRDGKHWVRDQAPFFNRNPATGTWDHAFAWIDEQLPVDDEVYLYYGGYDSGHKSAFPNGRQLGLLKMQRDRYVAWEAGENEGYFVTPKTVWNGEGLTLNADAAQGQIVVEILDENGNPVPGFTAADFTPITTDGLDIPASWGNSLSTLQGQTIQLKFTLQNAKIFAFDVVGGSIPPTSPTTYSVSGYVYQDLNTTSCCGGVKDGSEGGLFGRTVTLGSADGTAVQGITTTNANGRYAFTNLSPGTYRVIHPVPAGYTKTTEDAKSLTVSANATHNFGLYQTSTPPNTYTISGFVYQDLNTSTCCSGVKNANEPGIANSEVSLKNADSTVTIANATTDSTGKFTFSGISAGTYRLRHPVPSGYTRTTDDSVAVTLNANYSYNFGLYQQTAPPPTSYTISGYVYTDLNTVDCCTGTKDAGEEGIVSRTVTLKNSTGSTTIGTATTDSTGKYTFSNIAGASYRLSHPVPSGYTRTTDDNTLLTVNGNTTYNFGLHPTSTGFTLSGFVYRDLNTSTCCGGVKDSNEAGIANRTVNLTNPEGTTVIASATTNSSGQYTISNVSSGNYRLTHQVPSGYTRTTDDSFTLTISGNFSHNFGLYQP